MLFRLLQWVRNVERIVEEARSTLHDPSLLDAPQSPPTSPVSQAYLAVSPPIESVNATPTRSALALLAAPKATPTRTLLNGVPIVIAGGRPLADVPESVGAPSPARAFSTPPAKGKETEEDQGRVYETIAFGGFGRPIDGTMEEVRDSVRSSKLKRSKSKRELPSRYRFLSSFHRPY